MFSMGIRPNIQIESVGPGPGKYNIIKGCRYGPQSYQTYIGRRFGNLSM